MLKLDTKIKFNKDVIESPNLVDRFSEDDLKRLGNFVFDGYTRDEKSRIKWRKRTQAAMDLALQVQKDKSFPWQGASNIAFPLITIAALQFHSRAYPAIVNGSELVRYKTNGQDPDGSQKARSERISKHMSYQLLEEDQAWEEQHDRLLINVPIVGCAFKKTFRSGQRRMNVSTMVAAHDLVLDYYARSVEECERKTQIMPTYRNEIYEGMMTGIYRDVSEEAWYQNVAIPLTDQNTMKEDKREGMDPPMGDDATPFTFLEQHLLLDLDGDGYKEPYICTIEYTSKCVMRLVARVDSERQVERTALGKIIRINQTEYYTKYPFIPSPDGGIYDIGFGSLLGPLNESTNSLINQLVDAGTMANTGGGFLGRGAKIRGGVYTFAPLEWKRVDSTGDDLRKSIYPLPVREPSQVLLQLLTLLINYTQRISGSTDTLAGENPGQNTPATTTQAMIEQGMKIYNAIYKRVWRSMKEEFKKLYKLNATFLPDVTMFGAEEAKVLRVDYQGDPNRITPLADPFVTSETQRMQQAMALKQAAMSTPGYDQVQVERNYLRALHIDNWEVLYPGPDKVPPLANPRVQIEQMKMEAKQMAIKLQQQKMQLEAQQYVADLMEQRRLNTAKILQLEAQAAKLIAEAGGVETGHQIAAFEAAIGALKTHDESMRSGIETIMKMMEKRDEGTHGTGMEGMEAAPGNTGSRGNPAQIAG